MKREEYISDKEVVRRAKEAVRIELEKKKAMNIPAVIYNRETKKIYHKYNDGTMVPVAEGINRGRYSERNK